jgi:amino acid transporter
MTKVSEEGLVRGIRRWDLVALTINSIIGAGIFGLPAKIFSLIGAYSLFAFLACTLVVALIILCFAEVGSRYSETGGPYLYARETLGPTLAFEVGWLMWLARLTAFAANCNLLVSYLGFFWPSASYPPARAATITIVVLVLTVINVVGVREATLFSNVFTIGKLVPIILFILTGLVYLRSPSFTFGPVPGAATFSQSVLLLVYAFTGFEMAAIPAGEARKPRHDVPRALLIAIAVVALIYVLIQIVCIGTVPALARSERPLADAATGFLGTAGGAIISAGAIISITGNLNVIVLSGSRVPFAMAEQKQLPSILTSVHRRFFTPYVAIFLTAGLMLILTLKSSFVAALTISAIARLVTYAATCAALPILRRRENAPAALFPVAGGTFIAIAALILIAWLLLNCTWREATQALLAAITGLVIYLVYRLATRRKSGVPD